LTVKASGHHCLAWVPYARLRAYDVLCNSLAVEFLMAVKRNRPSSFLAETKSSCMSKKEHVNTHIPVIKRVQKRLGVNRYQQLYTLLSQALAEGAIKAGGALPTESALMRQHAISRNTVRRALEKLEREKRIIRRRGSGSYARHQPTTAVTRAEVLDVIQDMRRVESATTWRLLYFGYLETPPHVLAKSPAFGPRSLLIQRTRSLKERPYALITSYLTESTGRRLTRQGLGKRALIVAIEDTGVRLATAEQYTSAISANAIVAEQLQVLLGAPLFYVERISFSEDGSPVEFAEITYAATLYQQQMTLKIDRSENTLSWLPVGPVKPPRAQSTQLGRARKRPSRSE
jgi:GntR family transcriptional regulator